MLRELWERNLSVMPVIGKRPVLKEWSKYCDTLPTEAEIDLWEKQYPFPEYGVGLCCGRASNVIIIDWDTESPDIKSLVPMSPVIRFGSKGGASLYRYSPSIVSTKIKRDNLGTNKGIHKHEGIEVMTTGNMVVLPPSIHPDTNKPYIWRTPDTLENYSASDLPELTTQDVEALANHIRLFPFTNERGESARQEGFGAESRNGRLTQIVCAIISNGSHKKDEEIAKDIYEHDEREFAGKEYFSDKTRQHNIRARGNASLAALLFVQEHRARMIKKGLATPYSEVKQIDISAIVTPPPVAERVFPESNGMIRTIQQLVLSVSRSKQDEMALGSSIAILSALASNKFHIMGKPAITHQYIMNVARSGQGKGAGFYIANKIFGPSYLEGYNLIGLRNYSSIAAFVTALPAQRSRLDMIDEFSSVIESFKSGSQISKEIEAILTELYTDRGDYWKGHFTKTNGYTGGCFSPSVTVYANIQEDTLINTAQKSMIDSGLMSRFLYFSGRQDAEFNHSYNDPIDVSDISKECARLFPFYKLETILPDGSVITDVGRVEPRREPLMLGVGVSEYRNAVDFDLYKREQELDKNGDTTGAIFLSRVLQIAERIAIVNAVSCDRREITKDDYDYGIAVVTASARRSKDFLSNISAGSKLEKKILWAKKALKKAGYMTHSKMLRGAHISSREFKDLIDTMKQSGLIVEFKDSKSDALCYKLP